MRKGLRAAASVGADAAKSTVLGPPPGGGSGGRRSGRNWYVNSKGKKKARGLRSGLASGVKVSIQSGRESKSGAVTGEGVRISTTGSGLPADQQSMVKAYMAGSFRHPVFGGPGWAEQSGKNWFYRPLRQGQRQYQAAVVEAIEKASEAVARG